jgi:putative membrane protein
MENRDTKLREHLANERTFLAWVRTAIALIGLGFVIVKFALFLEEIAFLFSQEKLPVQEGFSALIGVIIVAFGVALAPFAFFQYKKVEKQIESTSYKTSTLLTGILTFALVAGGILLILHLLTNVNI